MKQEKTVLQKFLGSRLLTGILLGIFVFLFSACTVETPMVHYPEPTNYVVDDSGVISDDLEASLNKNLAEFKGTAEIAVVTVKTTQPLDEKQYAINLARKWGIGDAEKDNGVLFLIVTEDRKLRIETGRGTEGVISDAEAGRILDTVVPHLKENDWDAGIAQGVLGIMEGVQ